MVEIVSVGILGIQGAISEHVNSVMNAFKDKKIHGRTCVVKQKKELDEVEALIIPGGESTTILKVLHQSGLYDAIIQRVKDHSISIMGTCAGCVLLAKEIADKGYEIKPLQLMDIQVERNAFGRQKESFEKNIIIKDFSNPYGAVFIRAPVITKVWGNCEILAKIDKKIIAARQDKFLALSFHPELTNDFRIHKYFLDMI